MQRGDGVGGARQPGLSRGVAPTAGTDEFGQHGLLAIEVEVERATGDSCGAQDVADRQVGKGMLGEQTGGRGQDGLAQVDGGFRCLGCAAAVLPGAWLPAAGLPAAGGSMRPPNPT